MKTVRNYLNQCDSIVSQKTCNVNISLYNVSMSTRLYNVIRAYFTYKGLNAEECNKLTISDLSKIDIHTFKTVRNSGKRTTNELLDILNEYNLTQI